MYAKYTVHRKVITGGRGLSIDTLIISCYSNDSTANIFPYFDKYIFQFGQIPFKI